MIAGRCFHNGRRLLVTGPIACDAGESAQLRVTVTQRSTDAVALGRGAIACTGADQTRTVSAFAEGAARFEPGPGTAVGLARTTDRGKPTDAHQWLVNISLVED